MEELRQQLLSKIEKVPGPLETDCWIYRTSTGHHTFYWKGHGIVGPVGRFAYIAFIGPIEKGYRVHTKCRQPACINPDHLFLHKGLKTNLSLKYTGAWEYAPKRWIAQIKIEGIRVRLGTFGFESDAAIAYNYHAAHYFGEFATLNKITEYFHD
jgi:hypothetical protein